MNPSKIRKSDLLARIRALEESIRHTDSLLREWVEETEDLRKRMMRLEFVTPQQPKDSFVPYTQTGATCNTSEGVTIYRTAGYPRASASTPEQQQNIRDFLTGEDL
jgi:hypothetical protein